jgi:hypothetical protein
LSAEMAYKDPEKRREYFRKWRAANREKCREYGRHWVETNPDKALEARRKWREANQEKMRAAQRRRRAAKRTKTKEPADLIARKVEAPILGSAALFGSVGAEQPFSEPQPAPGTARFAVQFEGWEALGEVPWSMPFLPFTECSASTLLSACLCSSQSASGYGSKRLGVTRRVGNFIQ